MSNKSKPFASRRARLAFGNYLRMLREATPLSQTLLARQTLPGGRHLASAEHYRKLEGGQRLPSEALVRDLVTVFVRLRAVRAVNREAVTHHLLALAYSAGDSPFIRAAVARYLPPERQS